MLLARSKLNSIEILVSRALIDSVISHYEFFLINNVLNEYNKMKEEIKISRLVQFIKDFSLFIKQCYCIIFCCVEKIQKVKIQKFQGGQKQKNNAFIKMCIV